MIKTLSHLVAGIFSHNTQKYFLIVHLLGKYGFTLSERLSSSLVHVTANWTDQRLTYCKIIQNKGGAAYQFFTVTC